MANWAALQEQLTGKRVVKRAKHGIHFDNGDGQVLAHFSGKPCHWQDTDGLWKPIDTRLLLGADGFYGCPHSPVKVKPDGRVKVTRSDYSQFTELPGSPIGRVDGDKIVREFPGGYQELFVTEDGFREVITVIKPKFPIEKFLARQSGKLPSIYKAHAQKAVDANGDMFEITSDTKAFGEWLEGAAYPVVIDPDFAVATSDGHIIGTNADYATSRATSNQYDITSNKARTGQINGTYETYRGFFSFDTSSIGSENIVTQTNLKFVCTDDYSATNFDILIMKQDWSEWEAAPTNATKRETAYDGCLAGTQDNSVWRNTNGMSLNTQYASGNLDTSWINKTGKTYYSTISSLDLAGTQPGAWLCVWLATANHATEAYRPVLSVTYTAAGGFHPINLSANMQSLNGNMRG